ncbi:tol-pal system protein YbgF [Luteibacter sp. Sphag1AF]|uniref:tol-pal system protein YbgF n=1 Tax=Luteibacter sp. Sphag1AF TaxID=2587031 RepID=UPI00161131B1|nr:tol-pal system protein YbgF [Luteibacter sp. Sphag1AF]MBB3227557.1 tol-pal system protein YbgF [Luteibacter sp. Sphag1AF]
MKKLATSFTARLGVAGALASATLFGLPVHAQDSRLSLADRVSRLEQASQRDQGTTTMVNQLSDLQQQVQQLQGQIEELQHQNQQLQDSAKAQYQVLDARIGNLEKSGAQGASAQQQAPVAAASAPVTAPQGKPAATESPASPGTASAGEQAAYDAAFKSLRGGDFVAASRGFRDFLQQNPDSPLAPNAYYWLGESYYATMNYPVALEAFQRLVRLYPQSEKVPDGLLKVGYCQSQLKQDSSAIATLKSVVIRYPGTKAASLAQERLRRMQHQATN